MQKNNDEASSLSFLKKTTSGLPKVSLREAADPYDSPVVRLPGAGTAGNGLPARIGAYQVRGEIARGGIGVVLKAHDPDLGRDVALKVLLDDHKRSPDTVRRFVEEAQIGSQMQHPGIVPVHNVGVLENGTPYFTMKLVKGRTLAALLEDRHDPSQDRLRFLGIIDQVCQAVAYAHARNVIHRDLKPSNVMVGAFGEVQVMDWGLAKVLSADGKVYENRTKHSQLSVIQTLRSGTPGSDSLAGSVLGTPAYMSPEQARGEIDAVDMRSDVFGLGAILCEALTGKPAYSAASLEDVYNQARKGYLDDAHGRLDACGADAELVALAKRCLAFEPRNRPADAGKAARELRAYLDALEERARRSAVEAAEARVRALEDRRSRRLVSILGAAAVILVLVAGGAYFLVERESRVRRVEATQSLKDAWTSATTLLGKARAAGNAGGPGRADWDAALAAARGLYQGAELPSIGSEQRAQAAELLAQVEAEAKAARNAADRLEKDRRMGEKLGNLRSTSGATNFDLPEGLLGYRRAFSEFGLDLDRLTFDDALREIRESGLRHEIAIGLASWAHMEENVYGKEAQGWKKLLKLALAADPNPSSDLISLARETKQGFALRKLIAGIDWKSTSTSALTLLGLQLRGGDDSLAGALFRNLAEREPDSFLPHAILGRILDERSEQLQHVIVSLALKPVSSTYAEAGSFLGSEPGNSSLILDQGLRRWPHSDDATDMLSMVATSYMGLGRQGLAIRYFKESLARNPTDYATHNNLALAYGHIRDRESEDREMEETVRLHRDGVTQGNWANGLLRRSQLDAAYTAFEEGLRLDLNEQEEAYFHDSMAVILIQRKELDAAVFHAREACRLNPGRSHHHFNLARALLLQKKLAEGFDAVANAMIGVNPSVESRFLADAIGSLESSGSPDSNVRSSLERLALELDRILATRDWNQRDLARFQYHVLAKLLEGISPEKALERAKARLDGVFNPGVLDQALVAKAQALGGDRRGAISSLEVAQENGKLLPDLQSILDRLRAEIAPDFATFASIDAALEEKLALVREGDVWRYFPGERAPSAGLEWTQREYDDSGWQSGPSGFGFGDDDDKTVLTDMWNRYSTVFIRKHLSVPDPAAYTQWVLSVLSDDGFVAYLNGQEVGRRRAGFSGEVLAAGAVASEDHEATARDIVPIPSSLLRPGENVLAIQGLNLKRDSSDFTLMPELLVELGAEHGGDQERFVEFRKAASGPESAARLAYFEGSLLRRAGKLEEARERFEVARAAEPREALPLLRVYECLQELGRTAETQVLLQSAMGQVSRTPSALLDAWVSTQTSLGKSWKDILIAIPPGSAPIRRAIIPETDGEDAVWKVTMSTPPEGWEHTSFDDSSWSEGIAPFGQKEPGLPDVGAGAPRPVTVWSTDDIWLRKTFDGVSPGSVNPRLESQLELSIYHDDEVEVYLNGVEVTRLPDWSRNGYQTLSLDLARMLLNGKNVLAIHCKQYQGAQLIDASLFETIRHRR